MKKTTNAITISYFILLSTNLAAAVPTLIPIQGVLTNPDTSEPIAGPVDARFALYPSETATEADILWQESYDTGTDSHQLELEQGFFTAYLGELIPLDILSIADASELWLGITINQDSELPRIKLAAVPFAFEAQVCRELGTLTDEDGTYLANFIDNPCSDGEYFRGFDGSGNPICALDLNDTGVTEVQAGVGISISGSIDTPNVSVDAGTGLTFNSNTLEVDFTAVSDSGHNHDGDYQIPLSGTACTATQYVSSINPLTGVYTCDTPPDVSAISECIGDTYLNGNGACNAMTVDTTLSDSDVLTIVSDNGYINSCGTCDGTFVNVIGDVMTGPLEINAGVPGGSTLLATTDQSDGQAIVAHNTAPTSGMNQVAIVGESDSITGVGVVGKANSSGGIGVKGVAASVVNYGLYTDQSAYVGTNLVVDGDITLTGSVISSETTSKIHHMGATDFRIAAAAWGVTGFDCDPMGSGIKYPAHYCSSTTPGTSIAFGMPTNIPSQSTITGAGCFISRTDGADVFEIAIFHGSGAIASLNSGDVPPDSGNHNLEITGLNQVVSSADGNARGTVMTVSIQDGGDAQRPALFTCWVKYTQLIYY